MKSTFDVRPIERQLHPILASIRATAEAMRHPPSPGESPAAAHPPFVTISRQSGAGAWTVAQRLVERLNVIDPGERPWTCWEKELVEKVAADHHISRDLVESLEERSRSWLDEALAGLSPRAEYADEYTVYRRVAATVRALAQVGRVVIVGRGGVYITRGMPGGIHLRLVAPLAHRIESMARSLNVSESDAATVVREMERARDAFYRRYWPKEPLIAESFTAVLNTAAIAEEFLSDWVATLVNGQKAAIAPACV